MTKEISTISNCIITESDINGYVSSMPDPKVIVEIEELVEDMAEAIDEGKVVGLNMDANLRHFFADGIYAREFTIKKGQYIVGKIHKTKHINIISIGDISVKTPFGSVRYKAPATFISPIGTQRVVFAHEDTIWTTIHHADGHDLDKIEDEVIAKSYGEIPEVFGPCLPSKEKLKCLGDS